MKRINWRKVGAVADAVWRVLLGLVVLLCIFREDYSAAVVFMLFLVSSHLVEIERAIKARSKITLVMKDDR